jgi:hypothetical protein
MNNDNSANTADAIKKKRGRKKKEEIVTSNNITMIIEEIDQCGVAETITDNSIKKRGRKPKGGKLIIKPPEKTDLVKPVTNIILHLKCSMLDLTEHNNNIQNIVKDPLLYNPNIPPNIMTYEGNGVKLFSEYQPNEESSKETQDEVNKRFAYTEFEASKQSPSVLCSSCNLKLEVAENDDDSDVNIKDINFKLKKLKLQLYKNTNPDKKAACFWCTYEFDNPTCYIPKHELDNQIYGYGSFCRPECAVAYLMKENIDDSTKFERYHLLNQMYSKVYDYKKNIKPAPNPYYLLDKFYGNLSIQEYRKLLKTEHMLLVIDKPMTRILPELHEDNEDFITNIYGGKVAQTANQTGVYKVKRQSEKQKGPSKNSIMKENFGLC